MSESKSLSRAELYKQHSTQLLLGKFISGEIERLEPVYDPKYGYRYPLVEALIGNPEETEKFLNMLYEAGILERKLYDIAIYCPHCDSVNISTRYCCPYCGAFNIRRSSLIEHVQCGYIDVEERFLNKKGKLVCPKCGKVLEKPDIDYRRAGIWCKCNECGKNFDIPVTNHFCRDCKKTFNFENAVCKHVYSYTLSEAAAKEATLGQVMVAPISEFLKEAGFEVESPAFLKGKSGATHMFDIAAYKKGVTRELMVMDLATSDEEISEQPVIAMFAKIFDVMPDKACLIAVPKISENGKKMASLYKIEVIEAENPKEVVNALKKKCLGKASQANK
ncbi:hypothetical protein DRO54_02495 [Candidatus Bathyarchaeota archaeon]|nr:MAG: hypothetical protein DRO54_02495 [Candidatus Bathyarchaeota archaeon]